MQSDNEELGTYSPYQYVAAEAVRLANASVDTYQFVKENRHKLPTYSVPYGDISYNPDSEILFFKIGPEKDLIKVAEYKSVLCKAPNIEALEYSWGEEPNEETGPWLPFKFFNVNQVFEKKAETPQEIAAQGGTQPFKALGQISGYGPDGLSTLFGGPGHLSRIIGGGLLGAGTGYLGGALAEQFVPEKYLRRGRLRNTLGIIGGLGGSSLGLWIASADHRTVQAGLDELVPNDSLSDLFSSVIEKKADFDTIGDPDANLSIPVDDFGRVVWSANDQRTPAPIRAAVDGLVASAGAYKGSKWVSPIDVARIAMGMGVGLASANVIGKTLGVLGGLSEEGQTSLQRMGTWTGALMQIAPLMFGSR